MAIVHKPRAHIHLSSLVRIMSLKLQVDRWLIDGDVELEVEVELDA